MRRVLSAVFVLAAISVVGFSALSAMAKGEDAGLIVGVASVTDGDTLEIHGESYRLDGFDAPERGRYCDGVGSAMSHTSNALDRFIAGRTVSCEITGHDDRNNRPVARCSVGGVELGDWMVRSGWARDWPRYSCGAYGAREQAARAAGVGLWGMQCPNLWPDDRDYQRPC